MATQVTTPDGVRWRVERRPRGWRPARRTWTVTATATSGVVRTWRVRGQRAADRAVDLIADALRRGERLPDEETVTAAVS